MALPSSEGIVQEIIQTAQNCVQKLKELLCLWQAGDAEIPLQLSANNAPVAQLPGPSSRIASAATEEMFACPAIDPPPAGCTAEDPPPLSEAGPSEVERGQENDEEEDEEQKRLQQEVNTCILSS